MTAWRKLSPSTMWAMLFSSTFSLLTSIKALGLSSRQVEHTIQRRSLAYQTQNTLPQKSWLIRQPSQQRQMANNDIQPASWSTSCGLMLSKGDFYRIPKDNLASSHLTPASCLEPVSRENSPHFSYLCGKISFLGLSLCFVYFSSQIFILRRNPARVSLGWLSMMM